MNRDYINSMLMGATIKKESSGRLLGEDFISRGFYIYSRGNPTLYLHHDGNVLLGVGSGFEKPAFWPTEEAAQKFLDDWICKQQEARQISPSDYDLLNEIIDQKSNRIDSLEEALREIYSMRGEDELISTIFNKVFRL